MQEEQLMHAASQSSDTVTISRQELQRFEQVHAELKFAQTKIAALNFEIARLKRWRFGSSSESLDTTTQAVFNQRAKSLRTWLGALNLGLVEGRQRERESGAACGCGLNK